jgi:tetratricopeptide (TPR) repeat protein
MIVAITGPPGIGKTALAVHWAHSVRHRFTDGDLYIDMRGYGSVKPLSLEQALDSFLRSLDVDPERIPMELGERVTLYRSILGDKNMLVVIDNVASVRQIRYLLPGSQRCLALVTSRNRLASLVTVEGATRVNLDVLSPEDAVRLLSELVGEERIESDYEAANKVVALCGYLPLALRIVAERAAARPHLTLHELARELVSEQNRLDAFAAEEDELTNVRAVFSWSYRALPPEQQRLFRLLSLHPGTEFSAAVAAALVGIAAPVARRRLQELASVHLVQEVSLNRYRLHDLLRAYSLERLQHEEAARERTHAVRRMLSWYLLSGDTARRAILPYSHAVALVPQVQIASPSFDSVEDAMEWYEIERINILAAMQQSMDLGQYDLAWKLPVVCDGFFELRSYWPEWRQIHVDGLDAAQIIGDSLGTASNLLCLGDACWRTGSHEEALGHYERSAAIADTIDDRWIEGFAVRGSGLIKQEQGNVPESIEYFRRALVIFRASSFPRGEGMSLLSLGKAYREIGELENAVEYCGEAVSIFDRIGDSWTRAWALIPLSEAGAEIGQLELAEQHARKALSTFESFADARSQALALNALGDILQKRGDPPGAVQSWEAACQIYEQLDDPLANLVRDKIASIGDE